MLRHPPLHRLHGNYLLTADWTTLAAEPCRVVELAEVGPHADYFQEKFRLVYGDDFARRMEALIETQFGPTQ